MSGCSDWCVPIRTDRVLYIIIRTRVVVMFKYGLSAGDNGKCGGVRNRVT